MLWSCVRGNHGFIFSLDNHAGGVEGLVCLAESRDDAFATSFGWSQIYEKNLVVCSVNDLGQALPTLNHVASRKLTFKDTVLKMVAVGLHSFEDFSEAFVIGDVIANDVGRTHTKDPVGVKEIASRTLTLVRRPSSFKLESKKKKPTRLSKSP